MSTQNSNFAVIFCGCETWPLTLREDRRLRVFESSVLRRIFGSKKCVVATEAYMVCTPLHIFFG